MCTAPKSFFMFSVLILRLLVSRRRDPLRTLVRKDCSNPLRVEDQGDGIRLFVSQSPLNVYYLKSSEINKVGNQGNFCIICPHPHRISSSFRSLLSCFEIVSIGRVYEVRVNTCLYVHPK